MPLSLKWRSLSKGIHRTWTGLHRRPRRASELGQPYHQVETAEEASDGGHSMGVARAAGTPYHYTPYDTSQYLTMMLVLRVQASN